MSEPSVTKVFETIGPVLIKTILSLHEDYRKNGRPYGDTVGGFKLFVIHTMSTLDRTAGEVETRQDQRRIFEMIIQECDNLITEQ